MKRIYYNKIIYNITGELPENFSICFFTTPIFVIAIKTFQKILNGTETFTIAFMAWKFRPVGRKGKKLANRNGKSSNFPAKVSFTVRMTR